MKRCSSLALALLLLPAALTSAQSTYQTPPQSLAALVDAPVTPAVSVSPDNETILLMHRPSLPPIEEVAAPEARLAGMRINPRNNGPSRTRPYNGLELRSISGSNVRQVTGIPATPRIRNVRWSADGSMLAFLNEEPDRIDLYVADVSAARARKVSGIRVNDAGYGSGFAWSSDGSLVVRAIPTDRGEAPAIPMVPDGPVVQENEGQVAPARTYQDLLQNKADEASFTYYLTSSLWRVTTGGESTQIAEAGIYTNVSVSPDGRYVLVEQIHEPFSYLVPAYRFPKTITVRDYDGKVVHTVAELPLAEGVPTAFGSVPTGVRSINWRADQPATLAWVEALDGGDAKAEAPYRDQVYTMSAPFDGDPAELLKLQYRYAGINWINETAAIANDSWWSTRRRRMILVDPSQPAAEPRVLFDISSEDRYNDPGRPMSRATEAGTYVVHTSDNGSSIYLSGTGASAEGNRPFVHKFSLENGETTELFRSKAPYYETPISFVDDAGRQLMTRRESAAEPPNYFVRGLEDASITAVTSFEHPYPELARIQKESISYKRDDGLDLSAILYLPADYAAETDGPLPTLVWAYPREFKSADAAGQRSDSPHQFKRVSYWGAIPYVTQGYAVIDNASMPVVGEGDEEPNDTFRAQLVANAEAVIDEGVRRGVVDADRVAIGGHSYGAFMTANLLAHSDLFRAGIARSGAYNRTLTPFGFQAEERTYWEAPEIYYTMSPFMHVDKINEPILMIHGEADNNSGTYPLQSRRMYAALKGLGKTARLVMLPHESHGYRARESIMHLLWETNRWLEMHVKNAEARIVIDDATGS